MVVSIPQVKRLPDPAAFRDDQQKKVYLDQLIKTITNNMNNIINILDDFFDSFILDEYFSSPLQAVSHPTTLTIPHGFGILPKLVEVVLVNQTTELGYSVGQQVDLSNNSSVYVSTDATNIYIYIVAAIKLPNLASAYALTSITEADWKLMVNAVT